MQKTVKRSFGFISLITTTAEVFKFLPWIIWGYGFRGFSASFSERILLVVSGVNACAYCCWFHSHVALRSGVTSSEVEQLLDQLVPQGLGDKDISALLFALHYAQSGGKPHQAELNCLTKDFSKNRAMGIQGLCAAIYFGNLCGNTFDAFIARIQRNPVTGSSLWIELPVFLLCAPLLLPLVSRVRPSV